MIEPRNWAWKDPGALELKKLEFASFCSPAKVNVTPRKARSKIRLLPGVEKRSRVDDLASDELSKAELSRAGCPCARGTRSTR